MFILDNAGYVGKGVFTEISDVIAKGLPVFLIDRSGITIPILSLEEDFISSGPSWTLYAHFDVKTFLSHGKASLSVEEDLPVTEELSEADLAALDKHSFKEGEGLTEGEG